MKLYRPFVACIFLTDLYKANSLKKFISQLLDKTMAMSAILISTASLSLPAYATSSTVNMDVKANITKNCTMSNTDLNFGGYDAFGTNATRDLLATATITTVCTSGTTGVVTMSGGGYSLYCESSKCHRRMANIDESNFLRYNIYTQENGTWKHVWSDNPARVREVAHVMGAGVPRNLTVYGRIFKNQKTVAAGSYADKVNITLTY